TTSVPEHAPAGWNPGVPGSSSVPLTSHGLKLTLEAAAAATSAAAAEPHQLQERSSIDVPVPSKLTPLTLPVMELLVAAIAMVNPSLACMKNASSVVLVI